MQINTEVFCKLIITSGGGSQACSKYPKLEVRNMFVLEENLKDEVDFLPADKHVSFLYINTKIWVCLARPRQSTHNFSKGFRYFTGSSHVRCYLFYMVYELIN